MKQSERIRLELQNAWILKLLRWWHDYNDEYLSGALRPPIFLLSHQSQHLGQWDHARRTLTISAAHIELNLWLSVMETLRHEMAHQYVDEVLNAPYEKPHGSAFREACKRLRCSSRARATEHELKDHEDNQTESKILRVLRKVLSLADSPNEHEAQAAMQKARQLLLKYNIDIVALNENRQFSARSLGEVKGRHASWEHALALILNRFFFVEVLWTQSYDARRDKLGRMLQIFGTDQNLNMAEYVYHYLQQLLDSMWKTYKSARQNTRGQNRQRYNAGVLDGFQKKMTAQENALQKTHALVWKGDSQLREYFRYINPRIRTCYFGGAAPSQAYKDGLEHGHQVTIHKPITRQGNRLGRCLLEA